MVTREIKSRVGIFFLLLACMFMYSCSGGNSPETGGPGEPSGEEQNPEDPNNPEVPSNPTVDGLQYVSTLQEYNRQRFSGNHNRGIVVRGTVDNRKISVYKGGNCTDKKNLLATVNSTYDVTEIELPTLEEGTFQLGLLETDMKGESIKCNVTSSIKYRYQRLYRLGDLDVIELNEARTEGKVLGTSQIIKFDVPVLAMYTDTFEYQSITVLFEDKTVRTWEISKLLDSKLRDDGELIESDVRSVYITGYAILALKNSGKLRGRSVAALDEYDKENTLSPDKTKIREDNVTQVYNTDRGRYTIYLYSDGSASVYNLDKIRVDVDDSTFGGVTKVKDIKGNSPITNVYTASGVGGFVALRADGSIVYESKNSLQRALESHGPFSERNMPQDLLQGKPKVRGVFATPRGAWYFLRSNNTVTMWKKEYSEFDKDTGIPDDVFSELKISVPVTNVRMFGEAVIATLSDGLNIDLRKVDGLNEKGELVRYATSFNENGEAVEAYSLRTLDKNKLDLGYNDVVAIANGYVIKKDGSVFVDDNMYFKKIGNVGATNLIKNIYAPYYKLDSGYGNILLILKNDGSVIGSTGRDLQKLNFTKGVDDIFHLVFLGWGYMGKIVDKYSLDERFENSENWFFIKYSDGSTGMALYDNFMFDVVKK